MNILVTVAIAIFGFFIALNIFNSNQNLKEAKQELLSLKVECENLKNEKKSIIEDIKSEGDKLFNDHFINFRTRYKISFIQELLLKTPLNKNDIFVNLSEIIENIDSSNIQIVLKCTEAFPNDPDFSRLAVRVLAKIT